MVLHVEVRVVPVPVHVPVAPMWRLLAVTKSNTEPISMLMVTLWVKQVLNVLLPSCKGTVVVRCCKLIVGTVGCVRYTVCTGVRLIGTCSYSSTAAAVPGNTQKLWILDTRIDTGVPPVLVEKRDVKLCFGLYIINNTRYWVQYPGTVVVILSKYRVTFT